MATPASARRASGSPRAPPASGVPKPCWGGAASYPAPASRPGATAKEHRRVSRSPPWPRARELRSSEPVLRHTTPPKPVGDPEPRAARPSLASRPTPEPTPPEGRVASVSPGPRLTLPASARNAASPSAPPKSSRRCRFCNCHEADSEEHMLLRCGLHAPLRGDLLRVCESIVEGQLSLVADDKERYKVLTRDARLQRPVNDFFKKCIRDRDTAPLETDASLHAPEAPAAALSAAGPLGGTAHLAEHVRRAFSVPGPRPSPPNGASPGFGRQPLLNGT